MCGSHEKFVTRRLRMVRCAVTVQEREVVHKSDGLYRKHCGDVSVADGEQVVPVLCFATQSEVGGAAVHDRVWPVEVAHHEFVMDLVTALHAMHLIEGLREGCCPRLAGHELSLLPVGVDRDALGV